MEAKNISTNEMNVVWNALKSTKQPMPMPIKSLNQEQRRMVNVIIENMNTTYFNDAKSIDSEKVSAEVKNILNRLQASPKKSKFSFLTRIFKRIGNFLNLRISSKSLESKFNNKLVELEKSKSINADLKGATPEKTAPSEIDPKEASKIQEQTKKKDPIEEKLSNYETTRKAIRIKTNGPTETLYRLHENFRDSITPLRRNIWEHYDALKTLNNPTVIHGDSKDVPRRREKTTNNLHELNKEYESKLEELKKEEERVKNVFLVAEKEYGILLADMKKAFKNPENDIRVANQIEKTEDLINSMQSYLTTFNKNIQTNEKTTNDFNEQLKEQFGI